MNTHSVHAGPVTKAIHIAADVHMTQIDKGGEEYILHSLEVMRIADQSIAGMRFTSPSFRETVRVVAILHDTIEDFTGNPGEKARFCSYLDAQFGQIVIDALNALTHKRNEPYMDYIERVAKDPIARIVKIADLTHNMDTGRLPEGDIDEKDFQRWDKYRKSLVRLHRED